LIEIIVAIAIIILFSMILVSDYPKIRRQFALSRSVYRLAQDLRKAQDLGLSGVKIAGIEEAKGYGIFISSEADKNRQYMIYADNCPLLLLDNKYTIIAGVCADSIIEIVDISKAEREVYIKEITNIDGDYTSINFNPPNPNIAIDNISSGEDSIEIVLALDFDENVTRAVYVNVSGLIEVK